MTETPSSEALWQPDAGEPDVYMPTVFTRGPWNPQLLHGGPVAALFATVLQHTGEEGMQPARLTVDLMRPVPLTPLRLRTTIVRTGRRLQLLEGELATLASEGSKPVARATLLMLRPVPFDASQYNDPAVLPAPVDSPDEVDEGWGPPSSAESFVGGSMDFRFAKHVGLGHGVAWLRLHRAVLPDRAITPLARAAAAADVGNAVSSRRDPNLPRMSFVNADLSLSLSRLPEGEWIRLEAAGRWEGSGIGWVNASMSDARGPIGAVSNALALERDARAF